MHDHYKQTFDFFFDILTSRYIPCKDVLFATFVKSSSRTGLYDETTKNNKITCTSCSTTMLSSECPSKDVCTLKIKLADGKLQAYACFNNALQSFLASIEKSTSLDELTKDELEDLFLNAGTLQMVVNNSMHVIDQFLPKAIQSTRLCRIYNSIQQQTCVCTPFQEPNYKGLNKSNPV